MKRKYYKDYIVGIDGGATKSVAVLAGLDGKIIRARRGKPLNYLSIGEENSRLNLKELLAGFLGNLSIKVAILGLAGLNTKKDETVYKRIVREVLSKGTKFFVYNDTKIALEGGCGEEPARLLIISGTGSNIYGEHKGRRMRSGGWAFLLGDEGSGYDFGMSAIKSAIRSYDGRGEKTLLEKLVLKKAKVSSVPLLINKIYKLWDENPHQAKYYIASFSPVIDEAYKKGDRIAKDIIENGAGELYLGARAVIKKLKMGDKKLCVGYTGSNFKAPLLKNLLSRKIKKLAPRAYFAPNIEPVEGAVKMAVKMLK